MAHDELPLVGEQDGSSSVALLPANVIEHHPAEWNGAALTEPAEPPAMDLMAYVHGLRRHWLMALGIGLLCAAAVGPAVWFAVGARVHGQLLSSRGNARQAHRVQHRSDGRDGPGSF